MEGMRVAAPRSPRLFRTALAVLALALLLPGLVEHHGASGPEGGLHTEGAAPLSGAYFPAAAHPDLPLHLEGAAEGEVRPCAACLNLQPRAATPGQAALAAPPEPERPLPFAVRSAPVRRWRAPAAGRAPPLS
jgi:hypothetical protein